MKHVMHIYYLRAPVDRAGESGEPGPLVAGEESSQRGRAVRGVRAADVHGDGQLRRRDQRVAHRQPLALHAPAPRPASQNVRVTVTRGRSVQCLFGLVDCAHHA